MARSREQPPGALVLQSYQELDRFVSAFADGLLNLLLILASQMSEANNTRLEM